MAIKYFRKNMKMIMVALGVPIMIAFLLPSIMSQESRNKAREAQEYGTYQGVDGVVNVTTTDLSTYNSHISILSDLGVNRLAQQVIIYNNQQAVQFYRQIGISSSTILATQVLFFGDPQIAYAANTTFGRSISQLADTQEEAEQLSEKVGEMIGVETGRGSLYYMLLAGEARNAGIFATKQQIDQFKGVFNGNFGRTPGQITQERGLTTDQLDGIIATYIAILRHGDIATKSMEVSAPQLKKVVRDIVEAENVAGSYVEFNSSMYSDKVSEPTGQDIQAHFDAFKSNVAGVITPTTEDTNPHGFGYMLQDRVKVEYLKVENQKVKDIASNEFKALDIDQQEDTLLNHYEANKASYQRPYDQEISNVKRAYLQQQTDLKISRIVDAAAKQMHPKEDAKEPVSYEKIAAEITTEAIPVIRDTSDFISYETGQILFGQATKVRKGQQGAQLLPILFQCKPLQKVSQNRYQDTPVKLFENITNIQDRNATYIVRIIAVDKKREAVSLDDDGRQGAADVDPIDIANSSVRKQVKEDWKTLKAFELTSAKALEFAKLAAKDFDAAVKSTNEALKPKDPNAPQVSLNEGDLDKDRKQVESLRARIDQIRKQAEQYRENPQIMNMIYNQANSIQNQISSINQQFAKSMKLAQEIEAAPAKEPVLKQHLLSTCRVFKDLKVTPPYQEDYNRRKTLIAISLESKYQGLYAVIHYNPKNIETRNGYKDKEPQ